MDKNFGFKIGLLGMLMQIGLLLGGDILNQLVLLASFILALMFVFIIYFRSNENE